MSEFLRVQFVMIFHLLRSSTCAFTESLLLSLETDRRKNLDISFFFFLQCRFFVSSIFIVGSQQGKLIF